MRHLALKFSIIFMLLITTQDVFSQVVIKSTYKPISYDEMAKPVNEANAAFKKASDECFEYYEQAIEAYNKQIYTLANAYIKRAINLNKRYNGNLIDSNDLNSFNNKIQTALKSMNTPRVSQPETNPISIQSLVEKKSASFKSYIGETIVLDNDFPLSLRKKPLFNAEEICKLPKNATVRIMELRPDSYHMKVKCNNYIGYISKSWILDYPVWEK